MRPNTVPALDPCNQSLENAEIVEQSWISLASSARYNVFNTEIDVKNKTISVVIAANVNCNHRSYLS